MSNVVVTLEIHTFYNVFIVNIVVVIIYGIIFLWSRDYIKISGSIRLAVSLALL